jgi:hypothetical protein
MIGSLRTGVRRVRYCDRRPKSMTERRHWVIAARCTCKSQKCKCDKREPHYESFGKECTFAEAEKIATRGCLCLECGG